MASGCVLLPLDLEIAIVAFLDITEQPEAVHAFAPEHRDRAIAVWMASTRVETREFEYPQPAVATFVNGRIHSLDDAPAIVYRDGMLIWYRRGRTHRDNDLPAVTSPDAETRQWYRDGKLHRDGDMPAVVTNSRRTKRWYHMGVLHRDGDQPALIETDTGKQMWYRNGVRHRDAGPAVVEANHEEYWCNGRIMPPPPRADRVMPGFSNRYTFRMRR